MVLLYENKENCCGCGACHNICPKNAISMIKDEYGFIYPNINKTICIECGLCKKVCVFQKAVERLNQKPIAIFAAYNKNEEIFFNSSSGGIFGAIATEVLKNKGIVFGATMRNDKKVEHIFIDNIIDIKKLQGSKYVQSSTNLTFREVKMFLEMGKEVLYTGTPCQIDALKSYLGNSYDNLLTVDLVCHGVPSNQFFHDYISWLESKFKIQITDYKFRGKSKNGFCTQGYLEYIKNGEKRKKSINFSFDYYSYYFKEKLINRDSCYKCPYASSNRPGDFTIGDYWGFDEVHPEIKTNKAVSVLIVNNQKALKVLNCLDLVIIESDLAKVTRRNKSLCCSPAMSIERNIILEIYKSKGAEGVFRYYYNRLGMKKYLLFAKSMIPYEIKIRVKRLNLLLNNMFRIIKN